MKRFSACWLAPIAVLALAGSAAAAPFDPLFRVVNLKGACQVRRPGATAFEPATKGKAYPYGTAVQTLENASMTLVFSAKDFARLGAQTLVTPAPNREEPAGKLLILEYGKVSSFMDDGNPTNALAVVTPVATCDGLNGRGELELSADETSYSVSAVASSGGSMRLSGPQFSVPVLKAGYSLRITTTRDRKLTRIQNNVGDFPVLIEKGGEEAPVSIDTSTRATIRIWRTEAPVGGRLIVSAFATGSDGKGRECFTFAVGQPTVAAIERIDPNASEVAATNVPPPEASAPTPTGTMRLPEDIF